MEPKWAIVAARSFVCCSGGTENTMIGKTFGHSYSYLGGVYKLARLKVLIDQLVDIAVQAFRHAILHLPPLESILAVSFADDCQRIPDRYLQAGSALRASSVHAEGALLPRNLNGCGWAGTAARREPPARRPGYSGGDTARHGL
jgi:hypothetical protein